MTTASVHEAHLSTGKSSKTIPLRATTAASGNRFWGTLSQTKSGPKFSRYGVNVPVSLTGSPADITSITVPVVDDGLLMKDLNVTVKHDHNEKGKARCTAEETFTGSDGEKWVFSFRATLMDADVVNLTSSLHRKGGSVGPRIQAEL